MKINLQDIYEDSQRLKEHLLPWPLMPKKQKDDFIASVEGLLERAYIFKKENGYTEERELTEDEKSQLSDADEIICFWQDSLLELEDYHPENMAIFSGSEKTSKIVKDSNTQSDSSESNQSLRYTLPNGMLEQYLDEVSRLSLSVFSRNKVERKTANPTIPRDPRLIALHQKLSSK